MLKVRAETTVYGDRRPLIAQHSRLRLAVIHHRLNRDDHALAQLGAVSASPKVRNLRLLVQPRPNAVPNKLTHYAESRSLHMLLHGRAHIANRIPDPRLLDAAVQRCFRRSEEH